MMSSISIICSAIIQRLASITLASRMWLGILLFCLIAGSVTDAADEPPSNAAWETPAQHDARMQWFRDAKLGMFIHWGLYSQLAGEWQDKTVAGGAEWIQDRLAIPSSQYAPLVKTWRPSKYQPREWVRLMKAAGIKYVCITTKHHDGFCLWPTKMNDDWNITLTPDAQDLIKPLADACHQEGLQFCIYHSVMDWHHADWPGRPAFNDYAKGKPEKARFKKYLYGQLKELFTNYGPIGMVWFDGTWDRDSWTSDDGKELEDFTRSLQPSVILDNRSGYLPPQRKFNFEIKNAYSYIMAGDYISPEGEVPATGIPGVDWETCQTMQLPNNWGYNRLVGFRPFKDLLRHLIDVASKGGNMLLNIGPTAEGEILPQARRCLEQYADWMKINSESIHGSTASPFASLSFDGRCTQKPGKLYLHVFDWPASRQLVVPINNSIKKAWLLANPSAPLTTTAGLSGLTIHLPDRATDAIASVVVLEIDGAPRVIEPEKPISMGRPISASAEWAGRLDLKKEHVNDGKLDTIWAGPEHSREGWLEVDLGTERMVSSVILSEGKRYTRCEKFSVEAEFGGQWKTIVTGKGIGALKELTVTPVKARKFRVHISTGIPVNQPDGEPVVAEFQIFPQPENAK